MSDSALEGIRHALKVARDRGYREVELEIGGTEFEAKLEAAQVQQRPLAVAAVEMPIEAAQEPSPFKDITSPSVGYYRVSRTPLEVGLKASKGDVVAVISALGLANDVESPHSGEVVEVLVEENQPVEYGQVLARVKVEA